MTKITDLNTDIGGCVGRCGKGCPQDGFPQCPLGSIDVMIYTRDCLNHDACCGYYGEADDGEGCKSDQCWHIFWFDCEIDCGSTDRCAGPQYVDPSDSCAGETPCHSSIQNAIDGGGDGSIIRIFEGTFPENINLSTSEIMTLSGGWDSTFTTQSGTTNINSLNIKKGRLKVGNVVLGP